MPLESLFKKGVAQRGSIDYTNHRMPLSILRLIAASRADTVIVFSGIRIEHAGQPGFERLVCARIASPVISENLPEYW
jgi:hypothetical protein